MKTVLKTWKPSRDRETTEETQETLDVRVFETTPAMVSVSLPVRFSRNFQSAGIEVGLSIPCYVEEIDDALAAAYEKAKQFLSEEIPKIEQALVEAADRKKKK